MKAGTVQSLRLEIGGLLARGATHHRDPRVIDATRAICQVLDPFGTSWNWRPPAQG